ncbi:MAG: GAF domain-containing sensor histidine kinase [Deltaproteobacteria bacterium]|nr:GAF domain-containing sensor histidine kinase [Deltaproteobacteria bacterium]
MSTPRTPSKGPGARWGFKKKMFGISENHIELIKKQEWAKGIPADELFWNKLTEWVAQNLLPDFVTKFTNLVDSIITIDPDHSEIEILELIAMRLVESLGAVMASVRIYDPDTKQLLSYGSYPSEEGTRASQIAIEGSVAGRVITSGHPYIVPDIMNEELYKDKSIVERKGVNSLMAIPFEIPRFFPHERNTTGVIQIYYSRKNRIFATLEAQIANLMSQRLGFVIARKKILLMQRVNEKKETILKLIFSKMGSLEGVKMKDIFNRLIPELADIINIQSCALFSVTEDMANVILEAGYPDSLSFHGIGKSFPIESEPAFELVLGMKFTGHESPYEIVTPSYLLVTDPQQSRLISENTKRLSLRRNINSILYIPLRSGEDITHFMTFDALDQRKGYSAEEIEILLFLGRELMKAQRMERLDDILHDFKNPAIATAGFARRVNAMIEQEFAPGPDSKISRYVQILMEETSRLQEMALSLSHVGKEQAVDVTQVLKRRFEINEEAIKEQLRQNITLEQGPFEENIFIHCYPLYLERILDNLLNNATKAIPLHGGKLGISTYLKDSYACIEVKNTGAMPEDVRLQLLEGDAKGRGFYITHKIIRVLKGLIDISSEDDTTVITLKLPVYISGK